MSQNGQCLPYCPSPYEYYNGISCTCLPDYELLNSTCTSKCLPLEYRDSTGLCQCLPGFYRGAAPYCMKVNCPTGTQFDYIRGDCITVCTGNQVYINGKGCVCPEGYNVNNVYGQCVPNCSMYEVNVNGFCQCAKGYIRVGKGVCIPENNSGVVPCTTGIVFCGYCQVLQQCGSN